MESKLISFLEFVIFGMKQIGKGLMSIVYQYQSIADVTGMSIAMVKIGMPIFSVTLYGTTLRQNG